MRLMMVPLHVSVASHLSAETYFLSVDSSNFCGVSVLVASWIGTVVRSLSSGLLTDSPSHARTHANTLLLPDQPTPPHPDTQCGLKSPTRSVRTPERNWGRARSFTLRSALFFQMGVGV